MNTGTATLDLPCPVCGTGRVHLRVSIAPEVQGVRGGGEHYGQEPMPARVLDANWLRGMDLCHRDQLPTARSFAAKNEDELLDRAANS